MHKENRKSKALQILVTQSLEYSVPHSLKIFAYLLYVNKQQNYFGHEESDLEVNISWRGKGREVNCG
jgi:hypothetical protein